MNAEIKESHHVLTVNHHSKTEGRHGNGKQVEERDDRPLRKVPIVAFVADFVGI